MLYTQYNCHDLPYYNEANTIVTEFNIFFSDAPVNMFLTTGIKMLRAETGPW